MARRRPEEVNRERCCSEGKFLTILLDTHLSEKINFFTSLFPYLYLKLQFGIRTLQSIPEFGDKLTVYQEKEEVFTRELQDFEVEYDDLCESSDLLKDCWKKKSEVIKKNRPFERELKIFKADVSELKQEYEECIKLHQTGYLD